MIIDDDTLRLRTLTSWLASYSVQVASKPTEVQQQLRDSVPSSPLLVLIAVPPISLTKSAARTAAPPTQQASLETLLAQTCHDILAVSKTATIILLDDEDTPSLRVAGLEAGALACLRAPINKAELLALVHQHVQRLRHMARPRTHNSERADGVSSTRSASLQDINPHKHESSTVRQRPITLSGRTRKPRSATDSEQHKGYLLGSSHVLAGNRELRLGASRALALMGYLLEQDIEIPRATLVNLLWREDEATNVSSSFRTMLTRLRQQVPDLLMITRSSVRLNRDAVHWDTAHFRQLAQTKDIDALEQASMLYRGQFLEDATFEGSDAWHLWLEHTRSKWQDAHNEVVRGITDYYLEQHQPERALRYVERWLALEPWQERAHRQLMFVHWKSRQYESALSAFERCQTILAEELGSNPEAYTVAMYQHINHDMHKQTLS
ncbi:MAG: BTAD domain-containing putative transcriptional regulator [Deinococcota bacterium]